MYFYTIFLFVCCFWFGVIYQTPFLFFLIFSFFLYFFCLFVAGFIFVCCCIIKYLQKNVYTIFISFFFSPFCMYVYVFECVYIYYHMLRVCVCVFSWTLYKSRYKFLLEFFFFIISFSSYKKELIDCYC